MTTAPGSAWFWLS